jgi:REP element-mobilizing transposase RayT
MHAYLATICRDLGDEGFCVGGVSDHVHVVTTLPRTLSQAELIEQIKKPSSKWIKAFGARYRGFSWQRGYAAFSVSPSHLEAVLQYVQITIPGAMPQADARRAFGVKQIPKTGLSDGTRCV